MSDPPHTPPPYGRPPEPAGFHSPVGPGGPPPPAAVAPRVDDPAGGTWLGVAAGVAMLALSLFACVGTGAVAALESETHAMQAAYLTVPAVFAGLWPWIVALLTRKQSPALAVGAPLGCGCVAWVAGVVGVIVFFQIVWPSL